MVFITLLYCSTWNGVEQIFPARSLLLLFWKIKKLIKPLKIILFMKIENNLIAKSIKCTLNSTLTTSYNKSSILFVKKIISPSGYDVYYYS